MRIVKTIFVLIFIQLLQVSATRPFQTVTLTADSGKYRIELRPRQDVAVAIFNEHDIPLHKIPITNIFTHAEHVFDGEGDYRITTAGIDWYIDAISFIPPDDTQIFIRHRTGRYTRIELATGKVTVTTKAESYNADAIARVLAVSLLDSNDPRERKTGCIHCGQLKVNTAIPRLRKLLSDDSQSGTWGSKDLRQKYVFYVRKAASESLKSMGETHDEVTVEYYPKTTTRYNFEEKKMVTLSNDLETLKAFDEIQHKSLKDR